MNQNFKNTWMIAVFGLGVTTSSLMAQALPPGPGVGEAGSRAAAAPVAVGAVDQQNKKKVQDLGSELLLLQKTEHFYTHLSVAGTYNTNAFYNYQELSDWSLESAFDFGARTVLGGNFFIDAAFLLNRSDYDQFDTLSRHVLGGRVTLGGVVGGVPIGLSYLGQWYFDSDFESQDLNFQTLSLSVPAIRTSLGSDVNLVISPYFNWVKSSPSTFDQIVPGVAVGFTAKLGEKTSVGLTVLESYSHYQHYLPNVFHETDRDDWTTTAIFNITHKITKRLDVRLEARFSHNNSNLQALELTSGKTVNLYNYDAWLFTPTLSLSYTF